MSISRSARAAMRLAVLYAGLGIVGLAILLAGFGFLIAGFYLWLTHIESTAAAAAMTGGGLVAIAVAAVMTGGAVVRKIRRRQPGLLAELGGTLGLAARLVSMIVRRDPRKAVIVALVAGALAEYITGASRKD